MTTIVLSCGEGKVLVDIVVVDDAGGWAVTVAVRVTMLAVTVTVLSNETLVSEKVTLLLIAVVDVDVIVLSTESVVWEEARSVLLAVVEVPESVPSTLLAFSGLKQSTLTPSALGIGIAKHWVATSAHEVSLNDLLASSHLAIRPLIQAACPG